MSLVALIMLLEAAAFRDVSLEQRCQALTDFVRTRAGQTLAASVYKEGGCAEGNGLGGARYTLDLRLGDKSLRLEAAFREDGAAVVRLCDAAKAPAACFPLGTADALLAQAKAIDPKAPALLQAAAAWLAARPTKLQIFGEDYQTFVRSVVDAKGGVPMGTGDGGAQVRLTLKPAADAQPGSGRVAFASPVDEGFRRCFDCADVKCLEDEVRYRFDDRFFSLTRTTAERVYGAGWVIEKREPADWQFVCGISRYSLHSVSARNP